MQKIKVLEWIPAAKKDLKAMPDEIQDAFGYALYLAQIGEKYTHAKPLKGFGSAGVLEISRTMMVRPIGQFIPSNSRIPFTYCIVFRRNQQKVSRRPNPT